MRSIALVIACVAAAGAGWVGSAQVPAPMPAQTGTALIAGQVVEHPSGRGVPGAAVTSSGRTGGGFRQIVADSEGRFFFSQLPAGTYVNSAAKPGFMAMGTQTIDLADGERLTTLKVRLIRPASVTGVIRDETGDPVVGTDVIALRRASLQGRAPVLLPAGRGRTDDRGVYRVSGLQPGAYFICACSRDPIPFDGQLLTTLAAEPLNLMAVALRAITVGADVASLDSTLRTFAPTFHPNSSLVSRANRITLAAGQEKTGVDVDVTAVRAARVSGTIVGAPGPVNANSLQLVPVGETTEAAAITRLAPMLVQADGRFDYSGVPPGQYVLHVNYQPGARIGGPSGAALEFTGARGNTMATPAGPPPAGSLPMWAAERINVDGDDVRGLSVVLKRGSTVSGKLEFVGAGAPPTPQMMGQRVLSIQPMEGAQVVGRAYGARINPDGTFQVTGLVPGRYVLNYALEFPGWPAVKSVSIGGIDATDAAFTVESADLADMVVTVVNTPLASISGQVTPEPKPGDVDSWVRIFPTDRRLWAEPFAALRRFRSIRVTPKGTYTLPNVPAGEYFLVVMPDEPPNEWEEASRLEAASRSAQRVRVADGEKKILDVKR